MLKAQPEKNPSAEHVSLSRDFSTSRNPVDALADVVAGKIVVMVAFDDKHRGNRSRVCQEVIELNHLRAR